MLKPIKLFGFPFLSPLAGGDADEKLNDQKREGENGRLWLITPSVTESKIHTDMVGEYPEEERIYLALCLHLNLREEFLKEK